MPWYSIRVSDFTKRKLDELKKKMELNTYNDVIVTLIRFYEEMKYGAKKPRTR